MNLFISKKILKFFLHIYITVLPCIVYAQPVYLFIDSSTIIGKIEDNKIFVSENDVAYTLMGKIIYEGSSATKESILLIADVKDMLGKKTGIVYQSDSKTVQYITQKGEVYLGDFPIDKRYETLLKFGKENDTVIKVKHGVTDSLIGIISGKIISDIELIAAAHLYIKHYNIEEDVKEYAEKMMMNDAVPAGGRIYLLNNPDPYFEWVWNGLTIKPAFGNRSEDEWKFDGKYIIPAWNLDPQSEWVWENSILKPYWNNEVQNQWAWNNNILKPFWDNIPDKMWVMEDDIIRPMWNFNVNMQWKIEGEIPYPLIALVILGIADR